MLRTLLYLSIAVLVLAVAVFALGSCAGRARLPVEAGIGPDPELPPPDPSMIPVVKVAPAKGWPEGAKPQSAPGFEVNAFALDLAHPRWLHVLPNGDVLVAETAAPPQPELGGGIRGWAMKKMMERAGSAVPSADRITLLRDADGDGVAEYRSLFLKGLHSPFGMALVGETLYVANTDALLRFPYRTGETQISTPGEVVTDLPAGPINYHWTKTVIASRDGSLLYVTVGSNSNAGERGMTAEYRRAAILEVDPQSGRSRVYASGLRNPIGLAWHPETGELWTTVNERDEIGSDLVPDYLTSVRDGGFYGWPYAYIGPNEEPRVKQERPDLVKKTIVPDVLLQSHVAVLDARFYTGTQFPPEYRNGAFLALHGSSNRSKRVGYSVVFIPFKNGKPSGPVQDFLTGWMLSPEKREVWGRPVGLLQLQDGSLLVSEDGGNKIWRVSYKKK